MLVCQDQDRGLTTGFGHRKHVSDCEKSNLVRVIWAKPWCQGPQQKMVVGESEIKDRRKSFKEFRSKRRRETEQWLQGKWSQRVFCLFFPRGRNKSIRILLSSGTSSTGAGPAHRAGCWCCTDSYNCNFEFVYCKCSPGDAGTCLWAEDTHSAWVWALPCLLVPSRIHHARWAGSPGGATTPGSCAKFKGWPR